MTTKTAPPGDPQEIFRDLVHTAKQQTHLRETLIADLRSIRRKYKQLVAAETTLEYDLKRILNFHRATVTGN
jgi:hypothetical protein